MIFPSSNPKSLIVVAKEPPWPANHGGRVDIWHRYSALAKAGWRLCLITWRAPAETISENDMTKLLAVFSVVKIFEVPNTLSWTFAKIFNLIRYSSLVSSKELSVDFKQLFEVASEFRPDAIVSESIYPARVAEMLAHHLRRPLIIRSHNIEHRYMRTQLSLATTLKSRVSILAALAHLKTFEFNYLSKAKAVLDISKSDAAFWSENGVENIEWVPSVFPEMAERRPSVVFSDRRFDAGYVGNLWAPNNVEALTWFLDDVLPFLRMSKPSVQIVIAGANPDKTFESRLRKERNVTLILNPENADNVRDECRVLFNPILKGSGLNTKTVEMLFSDANLVMTPFALEGLGDASDDVFFVSDDPRKFADGIASGAEIPFQLNKGRAELRSIFGDKGLIFTAESFQRAIDR